MPATTVARPGKSVPPTPVLIVSVTPVEITKFALLITPQLVTAVAATTGHAW